MNKENQSKITELIRQTKPLIFREMTHEKVMEKGAADYVTNCRCSCAELPKGSP